MADGKIFVITGFSGGLSVGVQADTRAEFEAIVNELRQLAARDAVLAQLFAPVVGVVQPQGALPPVQVTEAQAIQAVQQAFPGAQVVSTVGQPLPQPVNDPWASQPAVPAAVPQPAAPAAPALPPGVAYPGNCPHGVRVYNDKPARGKAWRRWECATPWKPGMTKAERDARCDSINVEN